MPEVTSDSLLIIALILAPGYITIKAYELLVGASARREFNLIAFESCVIGLFNFALWSWLLNLTWQCGAQRALVIFWLVLLAPIVYAYAYKKLRTSSFTLKWLAHPSPSSWDYVFGKRQSFWVLAHLEGGQQVAGFLGANSFASTGPAPRDLYLEQGWRIDADGAFLDPIPGHEGILIRADDCRVLEFFSVGGNNGQE